MSTSGWLDDPEIRTEYGAATLKYAMAALLIDARTRAQITPTALAERIGVSPAYIARVERGEANPSLGRIGTILAVMGFKARLQLLPLQREEHGWLT